MDTHCILFLHHNSDPLTQHHFHLLRKHNSAPIVPVHLGQVGHLADAVDLGGINDEFRYETDAWKFLDVMLYRFFRRHIVEAERYFVVEYDCRCTRSFEEQYESVWDADAACPFLEFPNCWNHYYWFCELHKLVPHMRAAMSAASPVCGFMAQRRVLERICNESGAIPAGIYCEVRLATAVRAAGFAIRTLPNPLSRQMTCDFNRIVGDVAVPGIYHPIKVLIPE